MSESNNQKAFELTKEQRDELKEAFAMFDDDGNGKINEEELQVVLEAVGRKMTTEEVREVIAKVDEGGDG